MDGATSMNGKKRIFAADDDQDLIAEFKRVFSERYHFEHCMNSLAAEKRLDRETSKLGIDLVILDATMPPGMHGSYLAKNVRERHPNLPVILYTLDDTLYYAGLSQTGIMVLNKGILEPMELLPIIRKALSSNGNGNGNSPDSPQNLYKHPDSI